MDLSNLQRGWKKAKKHWEVGIELSINDNPKSPQIHTLPQFVSMPGKNYGLYWLNSYNLLASQNSSKRSKHF